MAQEVERTTRIRYPDGREKIIEERGSRIIGRQTRQTKPYVAYYSQKATAERQASRQRRNGDRARVYWDDARGKWAVETIYTVTSVIKTPSSTTTRFTPEPHISYFYNKGQAEEAAAAATRISGKPRVVFYNSTRKQWGIWER